MTLVQLEYVLAVAESKNFTLAAEKAFVTQPTLSMQIQKLERELEIDIFDRSTHPIRITPIGERIIAQAKIILKESNRMRYLVNEQRSTVSGTFRIGVIPTVLPTLVPLFYGNFKKKFPKANLIIMEYQTNRIKTALENDEIDFGLAVTPLGEKDFIEKPIYREPMVAFVPPTHRLFEKDKILEKDLRIKDLLLLEEGHCFRKNVLSICNSTDEGDRKLKVDSGSFRALIKLAKEGFGMTILPLMHSEDLKESDRKFLKPFENPVPTREVSLVYYHTQLHLTFAAELIKLIQSVIRGKIYMESDSSIFSNLELTNT